MCVSPVLCVSFRFLSVYTHTPLSFKSLRIYASLFTHPPLPLSNPNPHRPLLPKQHSSPPHRYIASRIYLHNPPGQNNALTMSSTLPESERERREEEAARNPKVGLGVAVVGVVGTVGLMAVSAEWVSDCRSDPREEEGGGKEREREMLILFMTARG